MASQIETPQLTLKQCFSNTFRCLAFVYSKICRATFFFNLTLRTETQKKLQWYCAKRILSTKLIQLKIKNVRHSQCNHLNYMKAHTTGGGKPRIIYLSIRWSWVDSFTVRELSPRIPPDTKLCGPQSLLGRGDDQTSRPSYLGRSARTQSLYRLHYLGSEK
jgi:hypothetical protein